MADLFDASPITRHEKAECIRRELKLRRRVYPRWIVSGKLKRETAEKEIATMEAILKDYETA